MTNEKLKIGDKVFIKTRWTSRVEVIIRETKKRFYTENYSFFKEDNRIVGQTYRNVEKATEEHFKISKGYSNDN